MVWYKDLYADESIKGKLDKIIWKIRHNAGQLDFYVITLSGQKDGLLEIISTIELMQKSYPKEDLFVVGIAKGYENARDLACHIVMEIYEQTCNFNVREYLWKKHFAEDS